MTTPIHLVAATLLAAALLPAQVVMPPRYARDESPFQSFLPLGSGAMVRVQTVYHRSMVPALSIRELALRGNGGLTHPGGNGFEVEIETSSTPVDRGR